MSVKVVIIGRATAYDASGKRITALKTLRSLAGITHDGDICSDYFQFGGDLDDAGISGGTIGIVFNAAKRRLEAVCTYEVPRKLKPKECKQLLAETIAQLSDGIGEGCFDPVPGHPHIAVDVCPTVSPSAFRIEQSGAPRPAGKQKTNLWGAATKGDVEGILAALDAGTKVNQIAKGFTALHLAVTYGHVEAVRTLLENGADTRRKDSEGFAALHTCIASSGIKGKKRQEILDLLLDAGADVNAKARYAGKPLTIAVNYRRGKAIKDALISRGATE